MAPFDRSNVILRQASLRASSRSLTPAQDLVNTPAIPRVEPGMPRTRQPSADAPTARTRGGLATVWRLCVPALYLGVHGCTDAAGGAVELSWALRSTQDHEITDCAAQRIDEIQLWWQSGDTLDHKGFPCDASHGTTAFELPTGPVTLTVQPACVYATGPRCLVDPTPCECVAKAADSATFEAPPPLVRRVVVGETVTLDAVVMVIDNDRICRPDLLCP